MKPKIYFYIKKAVFVNDDQKDVIVFGLFIYS